MNKLAYLTGRIKNMHFDNMIAEAKKISKKTHKPTFFILCDMTYCGFKYMAGYMDYAEFEFYNLSADKRSTHVTRGKNNEFVRLLNDKAYWHCFENKPEFNRLFSEYIHRDWLYLRESDKSEFTAFVKKHPVFIAKPVDGLCGKGVEKYSVNVDADISVLYDKLTVANQLLCEEYVIQHRDLMRLFPNSVNTIRLVTVNYQGHVSLVFSGIRIGVGDHVVDNINSGGLAAVIDTETGVISTPAADKDGRVFERHPDTGTEICGFVIPDYEKAVKTVISAAKKVPQVGYVAWDVSITDTDVLLIEGNHFPGHDIYQMPCHLTDGYGILPRLNKAIGR